MRRPRPLRHLWLIGVLLTFGLSCSSATPGSCTEPQHTTAVTVSDFAFRPGCISVAPGATLTIIDRDAAPHTFTITGTRVDEQLASNQTVTVPLSGLAPGTYAVICRYHPEMTEQLKVG